MPVEMIGLFGIIAMFVMMFLRVPIAIAMMFPAAVGIYHLQGWRPLSGVVESVIWNHSNSYLLSTVPMFILMSQFILTSGISQELFAMFQKFIGRLRGGLAISTIGASSMFAAVSGSSLATTGTMGIIASREMSKYQYNQVLSSGSIVASGTLGILIPPSTMIIIYAMLAEQSIGKLLIAGIIPGIVLALLFMLTVAVAVMLRPGMAPKGESSSWKEKFMSLRGTIWIILLFLFVIGGMFAGWFTPTEAGAAGAVGSLLISIVRRKMTWKLFLEALYETLKVSGFIFAIMVAAYILNHFLLITKIPFVLTDFFIDTNLSPLAILCLIILMYFLLGAVMDAMAMVVVTIPIILPIIEMLGYDLIWFGILIIILIELAFITPPIGINCFVLNGTVPDLKLSTIFRGAMLFTIPIFVMIILIVWFPQIVLFLPDRM